MTYCSKYNNYFQYSPSYCVLPSSVFRKLDVLLSSRVNKQQVPFQFSSLQVLILISGPVNFLPSTMMTQTSPNSYKMCLQRRQKSPPLLVEAVSWAKGLLVHRYDYLPSTLMHSSGHHEVRELYAVCKFD
jgi:hypothetical protein